MEFVKSETVKMELVQLPNPETEFTQFWNGKTEAL